MANLYVKSTGSNTAPYDTWAKASTTVATALAAASAGDNVFVDSGYSETASGSNITLTGAAGHAGNAPIRLYSVDSTGSPEPPTTYLAGASMTRTGGTDDITVDKEIYIRGFTLSAGRDLKIMSSASDAYTCILEDCTLGIGNNSASANHTFNALGGCEAWLINCALTFAGTSNTIQIGSFTRVEMLGGSIAASGGIPSTLFEESGFNTTAGVFRLIGVDLSAFTSGKTLVDVGGRSGHHLQFIDCKLGSSVTLVNGTAEAGWIVEFINSDSADTHVRYRRTRSEGSEVSETTIVRTSGASDGTTSFSRKVTTNSNTKALRPYKSMWIEQWNETVGSSVTVTVPVITDNVTLTDAEAWLEVEYLGTSGVPRGSISTDRITDIILGTPSNQPTDGSSSWTTTGLTTPVKQTLDVSVTPQEIGPIRARVCVAKASTVVYYDPLLQVS